ncbi:MAG: caspase family protein [Acidobacteriota bacterium]|nr:caspase family protein [Acidobacteriota bacterium]
MRAFWIMFILVSPLLASRSSADPVDSSRRPGKKWALLVGINRYQNLPPLQGCVNDVGLMKDLLVKNFGFPPGQIIVLLDEKATRKAIIERFEHHLIDNAQPGDTIVFHFSGHGSQMPDTSGDEPDDMDETLVPYDSRDPAGKVFDISDDEINDLISRLSQKCKNITLIFDSCHSGAGQKPGNVRKVKPDRRTVPRIPTQRQGSDGAAGLLSEGNSNYTLISGCRSTELSNELRKGDQSYGALTFSLVKTLRGRSEATTWRDIMDKVVVAVQKHYAWQTPQLQGQMDRIVFGELDQITGSHILVTGKEGDRIRLNAGLVHGLTAGSVFEIYPPGTKIFEGPGLARLSLTSIEPFSSLGRLIKGTDVPVNGRAVEREHRFEEKQLSVFFRDLESSQLLRDVKAKLKAYAMVLPVAEGESYHLLLDHDRPKSVVTVRGADDLPLGKSLPDGAANAGKAIVNTVLAWAKWFNLLSIDNPDNSLDIAFSIKDAGGNTRSAFQPIGKSQGRFHPGDLVTFEVINKSDFEIYIAVLALSTDGSVSELYPAGEGQQPLAPEKSWSVTFEAYLEDGIEQEKNIIKIFAALEPLDMSCLEQKPIKIGLGSRVAPNLHPLEVLLGHSTRGFKLPDKAIPIASWATRQAVAEIRRKEP